MDDAVMEPIFFGLMGWFGLSITTMLVEFVMHYSLSEGWLGLVSRSYVAALPLPRLRDPEQLEQLPASTRDAVIEVDDRTLLFRSQLRLGVQRLPAWGVVSFDEQGQGRVRWAPFTSIAPWMLLVAALGVAGVGVLLEGTWFGFVFALVFAVIVIWQRSQAMERFSGELWPDIETLLEETLGSQ